MLRKRFLSLIEDVKRELGHTPSMPCSPDLEEQIKYTLNKHYEFLAQTHWPNVRQRIPYMLRKDQRFYSDLGDVRPTNIVNVSYLKGAIWYPLLRGIKPHQYANPQAYTQFELAYDWVFDANDDVMEIFPTPSEDVEITFEIILPFKPLVNETDICHVDGRLLVMAASLELMSKRGTDTTLLAAQYERYAQNTIASMTPASYIPNALAGHTSDLDTYMKSVVYNPTFV